MAKIKERVIQLVDFKGIKRDVFYTKIGMAASSFRSSAKETPLNSDAIANILSLIPDVNTDWLLTGQGNMLRSQKNITINSSPTSSSAVPYYNLPVSAGPLGILTYSNGVTKPDGYIDIEVFRRCDAVLPVTGVSMEPEIHSGDLVGLRKLEFYNWEYIQTGKIYMIITHEERMIKYISKADDSEYIVCSSPNYHDFKVRKADILEIYRVIASVKTF